MKKIKFLLVPIILVLIVASLCSCSSAKQYYYVFGTFLEVTADGNGGSKTPDKIYASLEDLENIISTQKDTSDIYKINQSNKGDIITCNNITMDILKKAEEAYILTNGAYDPSIYPLVRLFNFSSDLYSNTTKEVPSSEDVLATKEKIGLTKCFKIDYENNTVEKLVDGAMLDLGGIAKGYSVDYLRDDYSLKLLINLGGNISAKGKDYTIGISNPAREDRKEFNTSYFATFTLKDDECIATSGDYERYYKVNVSGAETIYNHIISPFTGYPVETTKDGMAISCSIISTDGALSDAIATAVIVLGVEEGIKLVKSLDLKAVIISSNLDVYTVGDIDINLTDSSYRIINENN